MRQCGKCKQDLPLDQFTKDANGKGGLSWRCRPCTAAYKRDYLARNGDKKRAHDKEYYAKNSERIREYRKGYYLENREKSIRYSVQYNMNHKEWKNEIGRRWYMENREQVRQSMKNTKARRRARQAENGEYLILRRELKRLYASPCIYCGARENIQADHVIPIARGGVHGIGNLAPACATCNMSKQDKTVMEWRLFKAKYKVAA